MKYKFYILLFISLIFFSLESSSVKAETETTDVSLTVNTVTEIPDNAETETNIIAEETTAQAVKPAKKKTIKKSAKVKVNKTYAAKTILKLKKYKLKNFSFQTNNKKIATVSQTGVITGVKKGTATITVTSKTDDTVYATIKVTVENQYTASDLRYMASIIYSEARGECYAGKKAVGIVVMNRVKSSEFPNSIKGVLYQKGQFVPTVNGSLNKSLALYDKGKMPSGCLKAAQAALNGDTTVTYQNKKYNLKGYLFFSRYVYKCKLQIQHHQFK